MSSLPEPGGALYPLANPKGINLNCELCHKPAFVICTQCRVTYYCSVEHQRADWVGIHEKICQSLVDLRKPMPFLTSEDERRKRKDELKDRQVKIIEITRTTGQKLLFEGRYEEAVPAALQSIRFCIDVHGLISVELVPSYLILGEASIGLKRLPQAEEYLSQAQWTVLKTPNCPGSIKSQLHRNLGLLFAAKGDWEQALEHLAHDIFYASNEFGTDDIRTSGGYFYMANVLRHQDRMDVADDLYDRVVTIWFHHLHGLIGSIVKPTDIPDGLGEVVAEITAEEKETLDEAQEAEAIKVLNTIQDIRSRQENILPEVHMRSVLTLVMLHFVLNNPIKGREFMVKADQLEDDCPDDKLLKDLEWMRINMKSIDV